MDNERYLRHLARMIEQGEGSDRAWAFRNLSLVKADCYSSDELIDLALKKGTTLADPLMRIRRGTKIGKGVVLLDGSAVDGQSVTLADNAVLDRAVITGSDVVIGAGTRVNGTLALDHVTTGANNVIEGLTGLNRGIVSIGDGNRIRGITVQNEHNNTVIIGDENWLFPGLSLNAPFPNSNVRIGNKNELGRDGGGVISSSYRFNKEWGGPVLIGSFVETTRGAEILGYSMLGYPVDLIEAKLGISEANLATAFVTADLEALDRIFEQIAAATSVTESDSWPTGKVSLFGTVKTKRCCVCPRSAIKDDTRLLCAYVRDASVPERCKIFYSSLRPAPGSMISVSTQDISIVRSDLTDEQDWSSFSQTADVDEYPLTDDVYYSRKTNHPG